MSNLNLSEQLKSLRKKSGISQNELGKNVGLSMQAINDIENGRRSTTAEKLIAIADYFNVSLDYLVGRIDDLKPKTKTTTKTTLKSDEQELLNIYSKLTEQSKGKLQERANMLLELQQEENTNSDKSITPQVGA